MDRLIKFTRRLKQISLLHLATVGNHPGWWTILKKSPHDMSILELVLFSYHPFQLTNQI